MIMLLMSRVILSFFAFLFLLFRWNTDYCGVGVALRVQCRVECTFYLVIRGRESG